jgi:biotin-(acetyl-CoA carboxylase) ligase
METGSYHDRVPVIRAFLERFGTAYRVFLNHGVASIVQRWGDLSGMIGRHVQVETAGAYLGGTVSRVDGDGCLVLRCADGSERRVLSGDITLPEQP